MAMHRVRVVQVRTYEMYFENVEADSYEEARDKVDFHVQQLKAKGWEGMFENSMHQIDVQLEVDDICTPF